jgi:hypothetical protein
MKRLLKEIAILLGKGLALIFCFVAAVVIVKWLKIECQKGNKIAICISIVVLAALCGLALYAAFRKRESKDSE